jgi:hypothetical protein
MLARRLAGFLIALLSLHLNFVGLDVACADHHQSRVARESMASMQHHESAADGAAVADQEPCEIPTQPDCCRAMTSCTVSVALDASGGASKVASHHAIVVPPSMRVPRSQTAAPDPPPPKA